MVNTLHLRFTALENLSFDMPGAVYTMDEVRTHCRPDDCWIVLDGFVYDVTEYIAKGEHPGGTAVLCAWAGADATAEFKFVAAHGQCHVPPQLSQFFLGAVTPQVQGDGPGETGQSPGGPLSPRACPEHLRSPRAPGFQEMLPEVAAATGRAETPLLRSRSGLRLHALSTPSGFARRTWTPQLGRETLESLCPVPTTACSPSAR